MVGVSDGDGVNVSVGDEVTLGTGEAVPVGDGAIIGKAAKPIPDISSDAIQRPIIKPMARYLVVGLMLS